MVFLALFVRKALDNELSLLFGLLALGLAVVQFPVRYFTPKHFVASEAFIAKSTSDPILSTKQLHLRATLLLKEPYMAERLALLHDLLLQPTTFRSRSVERVRIDRRQTTKQVQTWFTLPDIYDQIGEAGTVLVPILVPIKGRLYEDSTVTDSEGHQAFTYAQDDTQVIAAALLLARLQMTCALSPDFDWAGPPLDTALDLLYWLARPHCNLKGLDETELRGRLREPLRKLVSNDVSSAPAKAGVAATGGGAADGAQPSTAELDDVESLMNLAYTLTRRYLVLAVIPYAKIFSLTVAYKEATRTLQTGHAPPNYLFLVRLVRQMLNVRSEVVRIPLSPAMKARSFHLYIDIPEGSYVGPADIYRRNTHIPVIARQTEDTTLAVPYLRRLVRRPSGIQAYGRGLSALPGAIDVEFYVYERPTGSELLGAVSALAVVVLALALRVASSAPGSGTDVPTVMLTLPVAIVTVAALFSPIARRSLTLSPAGVIAGVVSSLAAVVFTIAFAIDIATRNVKQTHFAPFWAWAVAGSISFAAACCVVLCIRTLRYAVRTRGDAH